MIEAGNEEAMTLDRNKLKERLNVGMMDVMPTETVRALLAELEAAEGELRSVDEALARRPALADCKDRYEAVSLACNSAQKLMDESHKNLRRAEAAEECVRELTQQRDLYKNHSDMYEETEAAICPDDLSFEAYIEALSKKVSVMETALRNANEKMLRITDGLRRWRDGDRNGMSPQHMLEIAEQANGATEKALSDQGGNNGA